MNWREFFKSHWNREQPFEEFLKFLKLDRKKIIIFGLLAILNILISFLYIHFKITFPSWFVAWSTILLRPVWVIQKSNIETLISLYLNIVVCWYLLSCLIIWIYEKVKKKSLR